MAMRERRTLSPGAALVAAWSVLVAATIASWALGSDHGVSDARVASSAIVLVAFAKVALVGHAFMELRDAPLLLRGLFGAWCLVAAAVVVGFFWLA